MRADKNFFLPSLFGARNTGYVNMVKIAALLLFLLQCGVTLTMAYVLGGTNHLQMTLTGRWDQVLLHPLLQVRLLVKGVQVRAQLLSYSR